VNALQCRQESYKANQTSELLWLESLLLTHCAAFWSIWVLVKPSVATCSQPLLPIQRAGGSILPWHLQLTEPDSGFTEQQIFTAALDYNQRRVITLIRPGAAPA
jgi:hypothetical protein